MLENLRDSDGLIAAKDIPLEAILGLANTEGGAKPCYLEPLAIGVANALIDFQARLANQTQIRRVLAFDNALELLWCPANHVKESLNKSIGSLS